MAQPPRPPWPPPRFPYYVPFPPPPPPPLFVPVDPDVAWLQAFRQRYCAVEASVDQEPPLRLLRRRVRLAQELVKKLQTAAEELAALDQRLDAEPGARLRVQRERKLAACEALRQQLEEIGATSGLFPEQQLNQIRSFAARVNKKKAYRRRAKQRRRAEASLQRAVDAAESEKGDAVDEEREEKQEAGPEEIQAAPVVTAKDSLNPETLTIDALISVRRAWDAYIVYPRTSGASTIPPHFVTPPSNPSPSWLAYAAH